jgi:serine/threonine protein kinase/Tfp pilus assembly protein PilF
MIGQTVSHYKILSKLGEGGMGVVYKAEDLKLHRFVALKFLPPAASDDNTRKRFVREAQAASSLEHPNICSIHEIDETSDGRMFIVMPCYDGESLQAKIERGPLKLSDAVDVALQIASGLSKAHEKGIVHRDIKPGNIFLTGDGVAKIVDFGLAKLSGRTKLTRTGTAPGTVAYMSPEQLKGGDIDHRSDIWALGVVFYEMITGETPFRGDYEQAMSYSIVNEAPKPVRDHRPGLPAEVERVIEKTLAKDPKERYQKTAELIGTLQSLKKRIESSAVDPDGSDSMAIPSIAVLPFANMSPDPENQHFGDGLAEELINAFAQIKGLHVAARTSAFRFRGENADIREIGEKLNVRTVLEGSVRKAGNRLRITAQLINIEDGYHIWSNRFDREMRDIFEIQDEIARTIADQLRVELVGSKKESLVSSCTENLEAYSAFLEGRYYWNSLTPEGWAKSLELYRKAIELDPSFALPHAWLAQHYGSQVFWGNVAPSEFMPRARAAAEKALELDGTLAAAHSQIANIHWLFDWDFVAAEREFKRCLEGEPGAALGRALYALFLACRGRKDEAVREAILSVKLDPLSSLIAAWAGSVLHSAGAFEEASNIIRRAIAMDPGHWQLYFHSGSGYLRASMEKEATAALEKAVDLSGGVSGAEAILAAVYYLTGKSGEADRLVDRLNERAKQAYVAPLLFAWICVARGEPKAALAHLERAIRERDSWLDFNALMPRQIRVSGPEAQTLLAKAGLR